MPVGAIENQLTLSGDVIRHTRQDRSPAGLPIARFVLDHQSRQREAGYEREARCRIVVMACGDTLAAAARLLPIGARVTVHGFICRADNRAGEARLVLHAAHIERIESQP